MTAGVEFSNHGIATAATPAQYSLACRAMDALPAVEREALILWNGGLDYREIAERTCQSSEAVGHHLARARNRLVMAYDLLDA
jgi:DNA-directed RNA polymerase specialized sigma24 family protein